MTSAKMKVNLRDVGFAHHTISKYATIYGDSDLFEWDRTCSQAGPTVYTDGFLNDRIEEYKGEKIAWLTEPLAIAPGMYEWIESNHWRFVEVWSHNDTLLRQVSEAGTRGVFVHGACSFVDPRSQRVSLKTKLCSFIASNKRWTEGHILRHVVRASLPHFVDAYGHGFLSVKEKSEALNDYAFSIAIENSWQDSYFTEKLVDCFSTGTVPIYWGTLRIADYFDTDGVIHFERHSELLEVLGSLSMADYERRMPAIQRNFEAAKFFHVPEEFGVLGSEHLGFGKERLEVEWKNALDAQALNPKDERLQKNANRYSVLLARFKR
jgi:hypothetical protein